MTTSISVKDSGGVNRTIQTMNALTALFGEVATTPTANTLLGRVKDLHDRFGGANHIGKTGSTIVRTSANFTRPADTTAYASGDLVANSTTAGSVVNLSWTTAARVAAGSFAIHRVKLRKSTAVTTDAQFRLHLYGVSVSVANGDNAAWSTAGANYLGSVDITCDKAHTDGATGFATLTVPIRHVLASGTTLYGLLEARAAYAPGNAEVFTVDLEVVQD